MHGLCFAELEVLVSEESRRDIVALIWALLLCMLEQFDQARYQEGSRMISRRYRAEGTYKGCYGRRQ
jgi:hypothetical protein